MPRKYSLEVRRQVIELARSGTRVKQLAVTFGVAEVTIYNWLKQDRVDRGEELGKTTEQQLELTAPGNALASWRPSWRSRGRSTRCS
jgi:transposase